MKFPRWFALGVARLDYGLALPALARLPRWLARPLIALRGCVNYVFDFDWRTLSLGHGYVREATHNAMQHLVRLGGVNASARWLTLRRFVCTSREEVDSWRLPRINYARLPHRISGLEPLLAAQARGQGVVLLTAHFDSLYIGLALLARAGLRVNLMATRITEDPRVPPDITRHYVRKAQALNHLLSPGKVVQFEGNLRFFLRALRQGDAVVIACDGVSTSADRADAVQFLGAQRLMASGPQFLAEASHSPLALFSCHEDAQGVFQVQLSAPVALGDGGLQRAFALLEEQLLASPWRWWGADQMRSYTQAPPSDTHTRP